MKLAGLMLYWAEGNKRNSVGVSNSDSELIRFMMKWFREVCSVSDERFKIYLNIHSGQDEIEIKKFWSNIIGLPVSQFGKSYIKKEGTGHRKNILYNGTIKIQICDKDLLYKILGLIEGVVQKEGPLAAHPPSEDFANGLQEKLGPLAQLVEHLPLKQRVAGPNPARPIFI